MGFKVIDIDSEMKQHICKVCKKYFGSEYHLKRHQNRKNPCQPLKIKRICDEIKCVTCGNSFSSKSNLNRHISKNRCKIPAQLLERVMKSVKQEFEQKFESIEKKLNTNSFQQPTVVHNTTINNFNIVIVNQGEESVDHITEDTLLRILDQDFSSATRELLRLIYFNKDVPQNSRWCVLYPNNEYGALQYNSETDMIERWVTENIVNKNFDNMIQLIIPKIENIINSNPILTKNQRANVNNFFHNYGSNYISNESPIDYRDLKMVAFNNRFIPVEVWKNLGIKGEHCSMKKLITI